MNTRQWRFVGHYLVSLNATQAAIEAGYSSKTAYSQGQRLLKNVDIANALSTSETQRAERTRITQDFVVQRLEIESRGEGEDTTSTARIRATELLGKHLGMFTDKVQVEQTGPPPTINVRFGKPAADETQQE